MACIHSFAARSPLTHRNLRSSLLARPQGVYKPGNVQLRPELLQKHQAYVKEKINSSNDKPVFFVFHGGSGSEKKDIADAVSYGVVKMNVDTDTQFAYLEGIRDFVLNKKDYLLTQVGNPEGPDKPNKKLYVCACATSSRATQLNKTDNRISTCFPLLPPQLRPPCLGS